MLQGAEGGANMPQSQVNQAISLTNESGRLADLGRREEALAAIEQATGIYRQLAETSPDTFQSHFAASLNNQSRRLADLGRREEALAVIEQATGIYRQLAETSPDKFVPSFAASLDNLADTLSSLNRDAEASAIREEADAARSGAIHTGEEPVRRRTARWPLQVFGRRSPSGLT
jgi:tetratricopeptide (TPR) repeat protein